MRFSYLAFRQVFKIFGLDKEKFFQGLLTCDVGKKPCYGALLSPQGRFLYDFFIIDQSDHWLMDVQKDKADEILKKLNMYKLKSDVSFQKDDRQVYMVFPKQQDFSDVYLPKESLVYQDPRHPDLGLRIYSPPINVIDDFDDYTDHRISLGIPEGPQDLIYDKSIILECGFVEMNAVSFEKGCYVGQELIARTHHTGKVRKKLTPVNLDSDVGKNPQDYRSQGKHWAMVMQREE